MKMAMTYADHKSGMRAVDNVDNVPDVGWNR